MDKTCLVSALLFFIGNLITTIVSFTDNPDVTRWKSVDPEYIQQRWALFSHGLAFTGELIVALAWFALTIPVIQLAWILSRGGKRNVPLHASMVLLVIAGCFMELITRLLQLGMWGILGWVTSNFNLGYWIGSSSGENDDIGWRVVALIGTVVDGMTFWVDAFEWLALSCIIFMTVVSIENLPTSTRVFPKVMSNFGILLGILCVIEFISDALRMADWTTFNTISSLVSLCTTTVILPVWLCILGQWLPIATPAYNEKDDDYDLNAPSFENEESLQEIN